MELFDNTLTAKEAKSLNLLIDGLKDVYRFQGSKHAISKPNSVYDHIQGLVSLIDEIFKDLPIVYSPIRVELLKAAYLHDAGEIFGELSVLDSILDINTSSNLRGETKDCLERIFFEEAIAMGLSNLEDYYKNLQIKRILMRDSLTIGINDSIDPNHTLPILISECKQRNDPKTAVSEAIMSMYDQCTYKTDIYKLFKPLDLIEGCLYYMQYSDHTQAVPIDHIDRYISYFTAEICKISEHDFFKDDYNLVKLVITNKATEVFIQYKLKMLAKI